MVIRRRVRTTIQVCIFNKVRRIAGALASSTGREEIYRYLLSDARSISINVNFVKSFCIIIEKLNMQEHLIENFDGSIQECIIHYCFKDPVLEKITFREINSFL